MTTAAISLKIDASLQTLLAQLCAKHGTGKSELMRRALLAFAQSSAEPAHRPASALAMVGDLVGKFEGGPSDLASNPEHLADFGRV